MAITFLEGEEKRLDIRPTPFGVEAIFCPYGSIHQGFASESVLVDYLVSIRNRIGYYKEPPDPWFPPSYYLGHFASTNYWGTYYDEIYTLCPICQEKVYATPKDNYTLLFSNVLGHIASQHTDFPFDMPKGGIVLCQKYIRSMTEHVRMEGYPRKPGTYAEWIWPRWFWNEWVWCSYTIPNWGDRVYIDVETNNQALVRYER